jgi:phospho-2-dehydro-3-deoxyheptonate aldolase
VHVILRGGAKGPNYAAEYVKDCGQKLAKAGLAAKIMVRKGQTSTPVCDNLDEHRLTAVTATVKSNTSNSSKLQKISYVLKQFPLSVGVFNIDFRRSNLSQTWRRVP